MRVLTVFLVAIVTVVVMVDQSGAATHCQDNSKQCATNEDCCSGCCQHGVCSRQTACLSVQQGACAFHQCPQGKECYLQTVQCVTAPCNPVPLCRSKDPDYE